MKPPTMRMTVSKTDVSNATLKFSFVATQFCARLNSSFMSIIHSVSSESMMVAPRPANMFLPWWDLGCSSSIPKAYRSYPRHACCIALLTASRFSRSGPALTHPSMSMLSWFNGIHVSLVPSLVAVEVAAGVVIDGILGTDWTCGRDEFSFKDSAIRSACNATFGTCVAPVCEGFASGRDDFSFKDSAIRCASLAKFRVSCANTCCRRDNFSNSAICDACSTSEGTSSPSDNSSDSRCCSRTKKNIMHTATTNGSSRWGRRASDAG
mmetsp:Transcript_28219/g.47300  ORF Transcript_28219/g.47300 Transcript_28219/m.47300 type:complete len:266 (+) Transcript_28219:1548-2345(+)